MKICKAGVDSLDEVFRQLTQLRELRCWCESCSGPMSDSKPSHVAG